MSAPLMVRNSMLQQTSNKQDHLVTANASDSFHTRKLLIMALFSTAHFPKKTWAGVTGHFGKDCVTQAASWAFNERDLAALCCF